MKLLGNGNTIRNAGSSSESFGSGQPGMIYPNVMITGEAGYGIHSYHMSALNLAARDVTYSEEHCRINIFGDMLGEEPSPRDGPLRVVRRRRADGAGV